MEKVQKVMDYIHAHYAEPVSRADIARFVSVSERHLDRFFGKQMCIPPVKYLNRYRVERARALLLHTDKSVMQVAHEVGFSGGSYFGEVFRRETGATPRQFRKQAGEGRRERASDA